MFIHETIYIKTWINTYSNKKMLRSHAEKCQFYDAFGHIEV